MNLFALDVNSDAVAYATLQFAMSTKVVNGIKGTPVGQGQAFVKRAATDVPKWKHFPEHFAQ